MLNYLMRHVMITCFIGALMLVLGCSGGGNGIVTTPIENQTISDLSAYTGGQNLGEFTLTLDSENLNASIEPVDRKSAIIVTNYLNIQIFGVQWDSVARIWDIDINVENPTSYTAYGPWVVFTDTGQQVILDQDGYIYWAVNPPILKRVPLVAFAKDKPQRKFSAHSTEPLHLRIHWPDGCTSFNPIQFFIDVSFPGARQQPIVENLQIMPTIVPETFNLIGFIKDWQTQPGGPGLEVWLDLEPIGGGAVQLLDDGLHNDGAAGDDVWGCSFTSTPVPHPVPLTVHAKDSQGYELENDAIFAFTGPPPCLEIRKLGEGIHSPIHQFVQVMLTNQAQWNYFWQLHGATPPPPEVNWTTENVIVLMLGGRPTTGYSIRVDCVQHIQADQTHGPVVLVNYTEMIPGPTCPVLQMATEPHVFFAFPKMDKSTAQFIKHDEVYECSGPPPCQPMITIDQGGMSSIHDNVEIMIRDEKDWGDFWKLHRPDTPIPYVDFDNFMVAAVVLGARPSSGYHARIDCVRFFDNPTAPETETIYTEFIPGPDCITLTVITYPFHFVQVPKFAGVDRFTHNSEIYSCAPRECVPMTELDRGSWGPMDPKQMVIHDPDTWAHVWENYHPGTPAPEVDFTVEQVIIVALGTRGSTGYSVHIDCVKDVYGTGRPPFSLVTFREEIPGRTCNVLWVMQYPYVMVKTPITLEPKDWEHIQHVYECD